MSREKELEISLRQVLYLLTNLCGPPNPTEYTSIIKNARRLLGDISNKTAPKKKEILEKFRFLISFNITLKCKSVEDISPICLGGGSGVNVILKDVDATEVAAELYELFGEEILIDFIKNG